LRSILSTNTVAYPTTIALKINALAINGQNHMWQIDAGSLTASVPYYIVAGSPSPGGAK
jgi:hypothetical protein